MAKEIAKEIARDRNLYWDKEQELLAKRLRARLVEALEEKPGMGRLQFGHAAAVLRQYADELVS